MLCTMHIVLYVLAIWCAVLGLAFGPLLIFAVLLLIGGAIVHLNPSRKRTRDIWARPINRTRQRIAMLVVGLLVGGMWAAQLLAQ